MDVNDVLGLPCFKPRNAYICGNYQWRKGHLAFSDELCYSITDACVFCTVQTFHYGLIQLLHIYSFMQFSFYVIFSGNATLLWLMIRMQIFTKMRIFRSRDKKKRNSNDFNRINNGNIACCLVMYNGRLNRIHVEVSWQAGVVDDPS